MSNRVPDVWYQEFLACFKNKDKYITLKVPGIRGNVAQARCNIVKACSTEFVAILDPDDLWDEDVFLRMRDILRDNPTMNLITCNERVFHYADDETLPTVTEPRAGKLDPKATYTAYHAAVIRTSALHKHATVALLKRTKNTCFALRAIAGIPDHLHLDECGYTWRVWSGGLHRSITGSPSKDYEIIRKEVMKFK